MCSRVLFLLLTFWMVLTQSAALGHAHDAVDFNSSNDARHIHTNLIPSNHHHTAAKHKHPHTEHHHTHHQHDTCPVEPSVPEPISDHGSDAVFVDGIDFTPSPRSIIVDSSSPLPLGLIHELRLIAAFRININCLKAVPIKSSPPPGSCPLYVWHLTLII